jgi:acyl carrier protein
MANLREDLLDRVQRVLKENLLDDFLVITEDTKMEDIPEWDSMFHVTLVLSLEREFDVRLNARETSQAVAMRPILDLLEAKLRSKSGFSQEILDGSCSGLH